MVHEMELLSAVKRTVSELEYSYLSRKGIAHRRWTAVNMHRKLMECYCGMFPQFQGPRR